MVDTTSWKIESEPDPAGHGEYFLRKGLGAG